MVAMVEKQKKIKSDALIWSLIIAIFSANLVMAVFVQKFSALHQMLLLIASISMALFLGFKTRSGTLFFNYAKDAMQEMRKVHWPTRPETLQMTFFVLLVVFIMSLIMWPLDAGLFNLVRWLTTGAGASS
ncbi:MAG: preprotein translocase subunit SecE [Gammaproteobacteria bacterium]